MALACVGMRRFNPRCPRGQRPPYLHHAAPRFQFQSTLPARAATLRRSRRAAMHSVSIHAARAGSDYDYQISGDAGNCFNPRCPRGQRHNVIAADLPRIGFQSTLPARAATPTTKPCGHVYRVSIHAARAGSDRRRFDRFRPSCMCFNPRCPRGQRREARSEATSGANVSIHAARAGSDPATLRLCVCAASFNPRCPRGQRPQEFADDRTCFNPRCPRGQRRHRVSTWPFQSTLPARAATGPAVSSSSKWAIQHGSAYVPKNAA